MAVAQSYVMVGLGIDDAVVGLQSKQNSNVVMEFDLGTSTAVARSH